MNDKKKKVINLECSIILQKLKQKPNQFQIMIIIFLFIYNLVSDYMLI